MNRDRIAGRTRWLKGCLMEAWGSFTHRPTTVISARRQQTAGNIQAAYGVFLDETRKQSSFWRKHLRQNGIPQARVPRG
jgi:uncharacterized protein YjbJ (UPF0337 family)